MEVIHVQNNFRKKIVVNSFFQSYIRFYWSLSVSHSCSVQSDTLPSPTNLYGWGMREDRNNCTHLGRMQGSSQSRQIHMVPRQDRQSIEQQRWKENQVQNRPTQTSDLLEDTHSALLGLMRRDRKTAVHWLGESAGRASCWLWSRKEQDRSGPGEDGQ